VTLTPRNIVATVNLECRLDLKTIALHARNAEYNPKVSPRLLSSTELPLENSDSINDWKKVGLEMRDIGGFMIEG
jgi:hypothetical protein